MDSSGDRSKERAVTFARLLGVRDGSSRDATPAEMTKVAKNLYFFLVMRYHEGLKSGKWDKWDEETHFPRHEFQSHSSCDNDGVFDGFDFPKWAELYLINGLEGTKAVEVCPGPIKKKKFASSRANWARLGPRAACVRLFSRRSRARGARS